MTTTIISDAIDKAIREFKASSRGRRHHPCEVTADRLGKHLDAHFDSTDGAMRDAISKVRAWLLSISEGA